jgi:ABC-2 type transport system ATP-binding protein
MKAALKIRGLYKTYANDVVALKGIDLDVQEGDFFALLGPNGAGKSTAIGIISSLVNKTSGTVEIFGKDLLKDAEEVKKSIGLVPQEINFNQFEPVVEIIVNQAGFYGIPRREAFERAERCLRQLGLWEKRTAQSRSLSGGMKRRLMIARALVHDPKLLILDEPTAGVDIEIRRSMWEFLRETNAAGTTIILTTHYLEEAESLCRNIAIINHGEIVENTAMDQLLRQVNSQSFVLNSKHKIDEELDPGEFLIKKVDENTIEATISQQQNINQLVAHLDANNIEIISMRNKLNRLEKLFLDMLDEG